MNSIIEIITRFLSGFVDQFKLKNPVAFTVVATILGIAYWSAGALVDAVLPDGTSLLPEQVDSIVNTVQGWIVVVLTLLGAHTPSAKKQAEQNKLQPNPAPTMYKG